MSFVVSHPFEESSYSRELRRVWKAIPEQAKAKISEMGAKFGTHAMVEGAVPVTFDEGTHELIAPLVDSKYIQSIPEVYGGNPAKFWIDASLLNYSMLVDPPRAAVWKPVSIIGTASCVISNAGDGAAIDVDVTTGNEHLGVVTLSPTIWVEPDQGIHVSFTEDLPEDAAITISWTCEGGERMTEDVAIPVLDVPSKTAALKSVA